MDEEVRIRTSDSKKVKVKMEYMRVAADNAIFIGDKPAAAVDI